ncbi:hypothetical protein [Microvirga puerhi]|uniref:Uncharacterized protein n=1 Tax=Microvirga puerhi TaxID=2876078 RepID=A0ABS7VIG0_9HYPH|nr:hypothetical protein [Microvirga puerhi]MBZ6075304.1 hypothetical protein [Microvirga puerhi]
MSVLDLAPHDSAPLDTFLDNSATEAPLFDDPSADAPGMTNAPSTIIVLCLNNILLSYDVSWR